MTMTIKAHIGRLTYRGELLRAFVIGSEHDYDRVISVSYPLFRVRCDASTGWASVAERTVTREELEACFSNWSRTMLGSVLAHYDEGVSAVFIECAAWDLPSFQHLKCETFNQDITL